MRRYWTVPGSGSSYEPATEYDTLPEALEVARELAERSFADEEVRVLQHDVETVHLVAGTMPEPTEQEMAEAASDVGYHLPLSLPEFRVERGGIKFPRP